jgi:hypothetical protein
LIPPQLFSLLFFPLSFLSTNEKSEKAELGGGKFKKQNQTRRNESLPFFFSTRPAPADVYNEVCHRAARVGGISNKYRNKLKLFVCGGAAAAS